MHDISAPAESKAEESLATIIEMPTDEIKDEPAQKAPKEERKSSLTVVCAKPAITPKKVVGGKWL